LVSRGLLSPPLLLPVQLQKQAKLLKHKWLGISSWFGRWTKIKSRRVQ
jgi:hypothetical protein